MKNCQSITDIAKRSEQVVHLACICMLLFFASAVGCNQRSEHSLENGREKVERNPLDILCSGEWSKETADEETAKYADRIRFNKEGTYSAEGGEQVYWDAGEFELKSGGLIRISNSFDAFDTFNIELTDGFIRFRDSDGVVVAYNLKTADH